MNWKSAFNAVFSAAFMGAVTAIGTLTLVQPINWHLVETTAAIGALTGLVQHFRASPGTVSIPKDRLPGSLR
jgi:hypothetical protein